MARTGSYTKLVAGVALACMSASSTAQAPDSHGSPTPVTIAAPPRTEGLSVQWAYVPAGDLGNLLVAIARPQGDGPFPAVLLLHGSHGYAREYVKVAQDLAREGLIAVAACWFSGGSGAGTRFVTPIDCPSSPPMSAASSAIALQTVNALVTAVNGLPGVSGPVALFGHSRGGGAALNYAIETNSSGPLVLNSTGYPSELSARLDELKAPFLILHGVADGPTDGGSPFTNIAMARAFEGAARKAGKTVEAKYYQRSGHNSIFSDPKQLEDEVQRIAAFVRKHGSAGLKP